MKRTLSCSPGHPPALAHIGAAVILFIFLFYSVFAFSQETTEKKDKPRSASRLAPDQQKKGFRFGLHVLGGRCFQFNYNLVSFDRFQQSYNSFHNTALRSPMGNLPLKSSWMYGGGVHGLSNYYLSFYIDVTTTRQEAATAATFTNGDRREMKIVQKPVSTNMDLLLHVNKRIFVGVALGVEQMNSTLFSGYRYNNAFLSYGSDQPLNGVYHSKDNRMNMGMRMDITIIRQLRLSIRGEYCGVFQGKQNKTSDYANTWSDQMYRQASSGGIHEDGNDHFYLPEDVHNATNDDVVFVGLGETFAKTYRGWRITTSLILDLLTHHN